MKRCRSPVKVGVGPVRNWDAAQPFLFVARHIPHDHRHVDGGRPHLEIHGIPGGPHAGAFLLGLVQDHVDQGLAGAVILPGKYLGGDFHQKGVELLPVPAVIDGGQLGRRQPQTPLKQIIGLDDQFHEAVLDAVVDHLDVVAGGARPQVGDAGLILDVGRGRLQDGGHPVVHLPGAAGHQAGAVAGPGFAPGDSHAHEVELFAGEKLTPPVGIGEMGVAAVDDQVAG